MSRKGGQPKPAVLFTAFEPSGDRLAAPVIRELIRRAPMLDVYALGGPQMHKAGAILVEQTVDGSAMGVHALRRWTAVRRYRKLVTYWANAHRLVVHVPVDSPAANFPLCRATRKAGARIVHLVAPQLWAWGRWRLGKLRRMTSLVLCVLPFEEEWFAQRHVPAKFIGHPSIGGALDMEALRERMHGLPQGAPRLGLFPGSRTHEVRANARLFADAYAELQARHAGLCGVIVAASPQIAKVIRRRIRVFPTNLHMITDAPDAVIAWCDLALAVSGTITLDIAARRKPMIGIYKTGLLSWLGAVLMLRTSLRLLPNIIAEREIVPEFVPHFGGPLPIVRQATRILQDSKRAAVQSQELHHVCLRFANLKPGEEAARAIIKVVREI